MGSEGEGDLEDVLEEEKDSDGSGEDVLAKLEVGVSATGTVIEGAKTRDSEEIDEEENQVGSSEWEDESSKDGEYNSDGQDELPEHDPSETGSSATTWSNWSYFIDFPRLDLEMQAPGAWN